MSNSFVFAAFFCVGMIFGVYKGWGIVRRRRIEVSVRVLGVPRNAIVIGTPAVIYGVLLVLFYATALTAIVAVNINAVSTLANVSCAGSYLMLLLLTIYYVALGFLFKGNEE